MHSEDQGTQAATSLAHAEALRVELVRVKEDKKLSLDAFAHDTQYSRSSWNRVLKGEGFPPREAIERLCARRKLDPARFLQLWETADAARRALPAPTQPPGDESAGAGQATEAGASAQGSPAAESSPADAAAPQAPAGPSADAPTEAEPVSPATAPVPAAPPAETSVPPASSAPVERPAAPALAPAAPAPTVAEEVAVVRPLTPAPRPGKKRKVPVKLLVLAGLVGVLVLGRWAALPDHKETAGPPAAGDRPTDTQPPATPGQKPNDDKPDSGGQPTTPGPDDSTGLAEPDTSSSAGNPPPGETPPGTSASAGSPSAGETQPGASPSAEAPAATATSSPRPSSAPATTAASVPLGAEGRENCNYNSDRTQTMAKGMVGSKVRQLQCFLVYNYDYDSLKIDGNFGSGTEAAVKAVQQCSGLTADGQVGPKTWRYLEYPMSGCGH
ncbi:peptidoglycan-binding protein [Streptomyces sp. NPDC056194]|uniref:peptidoglycan-binding protein n=1 Tax=Streptomyces sp. NPDC056194 TaxID=3345744 RepID=UPI0035DEE6A2